MKNGGLLVLVFLFRVSHSKTGSIDSLKTILSTTPNDTNRLKPLLWLSEIHRKNAEYDSALKYSAEALALARKFNSTAYLAKLNLVTGIVQMK